MGYLFLTYLLGVLKFKAFVLDAHVAWVPSGWSAPERAGVWTESATNSGEGSPHGTTEKGKS